MAEIQIDFTTYTSLIPSKAFHVSLPASLSKPVRMTLEEGSVVRVYTVNDVDYITPLQQLGVHAIFTDDPEKMLAVLDG